MPSSADRIETQAFVVAVREQHQGPASSAALEARLVMADTYLDTDLPDEAIEILLCAVMDSSRLHGPLADMTIATRIRLGDAYIAGGHLFDASGVHENLLADVRAALGMDHPIVERVTAIADATWRALEAEHGPISGGC